MLNTRDLDLYAIGVHDEEKTLLRKECELKRSTILVDHISI